MLADESESKSANEGAKRLEGFLIGYAKCKNCGIVLQVEKMKEHEQKCRDVQTSMLQWSL